LHRLAVVFPNRRQGIIFLKHLEQIAAPPVVLPEVLTIEELVQRSAALPMADGLVQGFVLYEAFSEISLNEGDSPDSIPPLDVFYSIGETLLRDFRDLDHYLANIDQVCHLLYNIELIDTQFDYLTTEQRNFLKSFWESTKSKSAIQQKFLKLWQRLPAIYRLYHQKLYERQLTTLGMCYRQLADGKPQRASFDAGWDHVAFAGFNAFNRAEETFVKRWCNNGRATLWYDADNWYASPHDTHAATPIVLQEAGHFLRRNLYELDLKGELPLLNAIANRTQPVEVIAVPGALAQAKLVTGWLSRLTAAGQEESAAILLADEGLLLPVLQSLPDDGQPVNITMGYPLAQSPVHSFVRLFFALHADLQSHQQRSVYFEHAEAWLSHPFCDWKQEEAHQLRKKMMDKTWIRVPLRELQGYSETGNWLFAPLTGSQDVCGRLCTIMGCISSQPALSDDALLQGLITAAWQALQQAAPLYATLRPAPSTEFLGSILLRQLAGISVPFEGEPVEGIQVMGWLESRGLDFDHLLVLGAGEGSLPRSTGPNSFLPHNVRRAFGLPVPEHQDAIFAYVFYRLLHRSSHITLVYNSLNTDENTGEPSRFIQQIAFETNIPVHNRHPGFVVKPEPVQPICIPKSKKVLSTLYAMYLGDERSMMSPTAIGTWLTCRLQFYFKYIARLKAPEKLSDGVEADVFGKVVHALMELLYRALAQKRGDSLVLPEDFGWMHEQIPMLTDEAFRKGWRAGEEGKPYEYTGELMVIHEVVQQYAGAFLEVDAEYAPFEVCELEKKMEQMFAISVNGKQENLLLGGYTDRVDLKNGVYRMVDYKTGGDKTDFVSLEKLFERDGKNQNKAALQTLMYSWLFSKEFPKRKRFEPALVPIREMAEEKTNTQLMAKKEGGAVTADRMPDILIEVMDRMKTLLEEMFDPAVTFDQTTLVKSCSWCDYKGICGR